MKLLLRSFLADAVEGFAGADEELVAGGDGAGEGVAIQLIDAQEFEGRAGLDDRGGALFVGGVDLAVGQQGRGAVGAQFDALAFVDGLAEWRFPSRL